MRILIVTLLLIFSIHGRAENKNIQELEKIRIELQNLLSKHNSFSIFSLADCDEYLAFSQSKKLCNKEKLRAEIVQKRLAVNDGIYFGSIDFNQVITSKYLEVADTHSLNELLQLLQQTPAMSRSTHNLILGLENSSEYTNKNTISTEEFKHIKSLLENARKLSQELSNQLKKNELNAVDSDIARAQIDWLAGLAVRYKYTAFNKNTMDVTYKAGARYSWIFMDARNDALITIHKKSHDGISFDVVLDAFSDSIYDVVERLSEEGML